MEVVSTRAITIAAPAEEVWRWLVQIGQDRAGFYSYSWIENAMGAGIHNSDRIVKEWQERAEGDFVRSARPDWLGGRLADKAGWPVTAFEPGHYLRLEGWGTFLVEPVDARSSRLIIRTKAKPLPPLVANTVLAWFPEGHFIMERKMLLGIKERAERNWRERAAISREERDLAFE